MYVERVIKNNTIIVIDKDRPINWKLVFCKDCKIIKLCAHKNPEIKLSDTIIKTLIPCIYFNLNITSLILKIIASNYYKLNL